MGCSTPLGQSSPAWVGKDEFAALFEDALDLPEHRGALLAVQDSVLRPDQVEGGVLGGHVLETAIDDFDELFQSGLAILGAMARVFDITQVERRYPAAELGS